MFTKSNFLNKAQPYKRYKYFMRKVKMVAMVNGPGLLLKTVVEVDIPKPRQLVVGLPENVRVLRWEASKKDCRFLMRSDDSLEHTDSSIRLQASSLRGIQFISPIRGKIFVDDAPFGFTVDPRCTDTVLSIKRMTNEGYGQLLLSYSTHRIMEILPDDQLGIGMDICSRMHDPSEILIPKQTCERLGIEDGESLALSRSPSNRIIESLNFEEVPNFILHMQLQGRMGPKGFVDTGQ